MAKNKELSNSFSTGGGGPHFEAHIQAAYVVLMLTGGYAPCFSGWPIAEIKLQGKIDGFETDDFIVFVEDTFTNERRKLIGQVKHSIKITQGSTLFGEVMRTAWNDFNNPNVFAKDKDVIALLTGPLSATDTHNVQWLLNHARHTKNVDEFFLHVHQAKFKSPKSSEKLKAIQFHLKSANDRKEVSKAELYSFLNHFHLFGYDLGGEVGVVLSLLHSHISQFQQQYPHWLWPRVVDIVQTWNQDAGTITPERLPEDLREAFKQKAVVKMPDEFKAFKERAKTDWAQDQDATYLALAILIGAWNEKNTRDTEVISQLLGISYDIWLQKAREILHRPDSPLSLKNGVWKITNNVELWSLLGSRIFDQNLDTFKSLAISVLKEPDPAFELPIEQRYAASIYGKVLEHSHVLRTGIAEGLALLGSQPAACSNCSQGKAESINILGIREILGEADCVIWGSLEHLLPNLAEAAPNEFLDIVEKTLCLTSCPFDELFAQEGDGITGGNYLTGLLWALEGLAWDEQYLVRVCVVFGELASHDPGGQWANRPISSLATILLPWLPQTQAPIEKRKVAVKTLLKEWPDVGWDLIIQLLDSQHQTSFGSYKPKWRKTIPDDWEEGVSRQEYWQQMSFYAELAVGSADHDPARLSELIDHFNNLPEAAFNQLIEVLTSQAISQLPEKKRLSLWEHLTKFTNEHRRFASSERALSDEQISRIESVVKLLAPINPFNLYQPLFNDNDFELYDGNDDWETQRKKLTTRRETAIREIFQQNGIDGVIRFSEAVVFPNLVGHACGVMMDEVIEQTLLPHFLDTANKKHEALVGGFIWRRHDVSGWRWCDNLDKLGWTPKQKAHFLVYLPFTKEVWERVSRWLEGHQGEYWSRIGINAWLGNEDLDVAIEKLIEYDRPYSAIYCLDGMRHAKKPIKADQCVQALRAALSSKEPSHTMGYHIIKLIEFLQSDSSISQEDLYMIEWAYLSLLASNGVASPKFLESKLASEPEFFCEMIQLSYRSKKEDESLEEPSEKSRAIAKNAWRLLRGWRTPPGIQSNETFNADHFMKWFQRVKTLCSESGHLEVALSSIGKVLIHAPADPSGLWIHQAVAIALNDRDAEDIRNGFRTATYNSRGVYRVDPTGKSEKELAEQFRRKAEAVEDAGFQRFAVTLRDLADEYERESGRVVNVMMMANPNAL